MKKTTLWNSLKNYHFNDLVPSQLTDRVRQLFGGTNASTRAFADKLARKRKWQMDFALRAIEEYKKFIYLGVVANFNATPSMIIDQVWHQHLLFTKPYRDFCKQVIDYNFDHHPELIPADEQTATFSAQYLDTLELYRKEFGKEPPSDIWSKPKFDPQKVKAVSTSQRKKRKEEDDGIDIDDDSPLFQLLQANNDPDPDPVAAIPVHSGHGFQGAGGHSGGAGASSSWESKANAEAAAVHQAATASHTNHNSHSSHDYSSGHSHSSHSDSHSHFDSGGHSGGDSGGHTCSTCSSGCGGGGGD